MKDKTDNIKQEKNQTEQTVKKGNLIVISGPSGTGKGTVCKQLLAARPEIAYSISATTRAPRAGEKNGREYWFLSKEEFQKMIAQGKLLEWAEVYGNYYGTPADKVREMLDSGHDVLLEIDTQGALNVQKMFLKEGTFIFLLPPSLAELERRIRGRGTETEEAIKRRLAAAISEIPRGNNYDYIITNDVVENVVAKIINIIEAERCAVYNNLQKLTQLEKEQY